MTITSLLPLLVCVVGLFIYLAATRDKVVEAGRLAFFAGLFVTLLEFASHVTHVGWRP